MKRTVKISFLLLTLMVSIGIFLACKRSISNNDIVGNQVVSAPSDFTGFVGGAPVIILRSTNSFDAATYPKTIINQSPVLTFGANRTLSLLNTMPAIVTWYVTFTGDSSHAEKSFTGTGNFIDSTSFKWDGSPDLISYRYFLTGETVHCHVSFLGSSVNYTVPLLMSSNASFAMKSYVSGTKVLPDGVSMNWTMLDNMEAGTGLRISYSDQADGNEAMAFKVTPSVKVDGHFAYYAKGTDLSQNNYNGGFSGSLTELQNVVTVNDPSQVYFNAYVYGYGRPSNSFFFQVWEMDTAVVASPGHVTFPSGAPVFAQNDMWTAAVQVDWVGWKLVSVPYSSFKPASNPASGGGGNRIKEPLKISGLAMEVDSYPTTGETVEMAFDMIIVSQNAPFQP